VTEARCSSCPTSTLAATPMPVTSATAGRLCRLGPAPADGGLTPAQLDAATMILWRGHCSVHGRFSVEAVEAARRDIPGVKVIVHPECRHEVVELADEVGSTEKIIKTIAAAPAGTKWVVGTELNLVRGLASSSPSSRSASWRRTSATARR
jgi:quinolinate synthase